MAASLADVAATAPIAFVIGVAAGMVIAQRYRIVRRNGGTDGHEKG